MAAKVSAAMTPTSHSWVQFLIFFFYNRESVTTQSYYFMVHLVPGHYTTLTNHTLTLFCFVSTENCAIASMPTNNVQSHVTTIRCTVSYDGHLNKFVFTRTLMFRWMHMVQTQRDQIPFSINFTAFGNYWVVSILILLWSEDGTHLHLIYYLYPTHPHLLSCVASFNVFACAVRGPPIPDLPVIHLLSIASVFRLFVCIIYVSMYFSTFGYHPWRPTGEPGVYHVLHVTDPSIHFSFQYLSYLLCPSGGGIRDVSTICSGRHIKLPTGGEVGHHDKDWGDPMS